MEPRRYVSLALWAKEKREEAEPLTALAFEPAPEFSLPDALAFSDITAQLDLDSGSPPSWPQVA
jgi:hypothetical protein